MNQIKTVFFRYFSIKLFLSFSDLAILTELEQKKKKYLILFLKFSHKKDNNLNEITK